MLDKEENAGAQKLLTSDSKNEREGEQRGTSTSNNSDEAALEEGEEDKDDNEEDDEEKDLVKGAECLANVLHTLADGLTLLADVDDLADHFVKGNVTVLVVIDHVKRFLGFLFVGRTENLEDIINVQRFLALHDEGHPNAAG